MRRTGYFLLSNNFFKKSGMKGVGKNDESITCWFLGSRCILSHGREGVEGEKGGVEGRICVSVLGGGGGGGGGRG